jgi:hypothetical protein
MLAFQEEEEADGKTIHKRKRTEPDRKMLVAKHQLWGDNDKDAQLKKETEVALPFGMRGNVVAL